VPTTRTTTAPIPASAGSDPLEADCSTPAAPGSGAAGGSSGTSVSVVSSASISEVTGPVPPQRNAAYWSSAMVVKSPPPRSAERVAKTTNGPSPVSSSPQVAPDTGEITPCDWWTVPL
jgi:hypothetical protein